MFTIGSHLSIAKGYEVAVREAISIGANTFQYFTRNPRGGSIKAVDQKDIDKMTQLMIDNHFGSLLAHAPYTYNLASDKAEVRRFAVQAFAEDLDRLESMPCHLYNFHPGSHVGQGEAVGMDLIVEALNAVLTEQQKTIVLLEGMSGKGTELGSTFEQLAEIMSRVNHRSQIGVCLDTCHLYSAGYDIVNNLEGVLESFDQIIGLKYLKAMHLNDSMVPFQSKKDRHEKIGKGTIGMDAITEIINHPKLVDIPFFLETPNEIDGYQAEIAVLKSVRRR